MAKRLNDQLDVKVAVAESNSLGALVGTAVDTTGYSRARFIFSFGGGAATTGAVSGDVGIWKASGTAGSATTFTSVSTAILTTISSGTLSAAARVAVIDMPTDPTYFWLKVSGQISSTGVQHSAVVELYDGINRPPTSSAQQLVTI